jgi:dihydroflavonol-4-reductase
MPSRQEERGSEQTETGLSDAREGRSSRTLHLSRSRPINVDAGYPRDRGTDGHNDREAAVSEDLVLVTGGSGFIGAHCILRLLEAGYRVRTTVRSLDREADVRAMLKVDGAEPGEALEVVAADLVTDAGWPEAVAGCRYVLHVASPFPSVQPRNEFELIVPARQGALRVLQAARDAGVARVVMTSSFAAIGYGHKPTERPFAEEDWTDLSAKVSPYVKSKTLAESAAWDFVAREGGALELAVVNPVGVLGPVLGPDLSSSIRLVKLSLDGALKRAPRIYFNIVDVRDVADLHLRAMTDPAAKGQRFLAVADGPMSLRDVADVLRAHMGAAAARVPTKELPDWLVKLVAPVSAAARQVAPDVGKVRRASNEKARSLLGWEPRSNEEAIVATAESLVGLGLVQPPAGGD